MKINHLKLFYNAKINVNYAKRCVFGALHALQGVPKTVLCDMPEGRLGAGHWQCLKQLP